jgi:hypothetical protein
MRIVKPHFIVIFLVTGSLFSPAWAPNERASSQGLPGSGIPQIEVRLSLKKKTLQAGDTLAVKVEVWNLGAKAVFIGNDFGAASPVSRLSFNLKGPALSGTGSSSAADCMADPHEAFASLLLKNWTILGAGHFYGGMVELDSAVYPQLSMPGRYVLSAKFVSRGLSSALCMNGVHLDAAEVAKLPYHSWEGQIESNSIQIEVTSG